MNGISRMGLVVMEVVLIVAIAVVSSVVGWQIHKASTMPLRSAALIGTWLEGQVATKHNMVVYEFTECDTPGEATAITAHDVRAEFVCGRNHKWIGAISLDDLGKLEIELLKKGSRGEEQEAQEGQEPDRDVGDRDAHPRRSPLRLCPVRGCGVLLQRARGVGGPARGHQRELP